MIYILLLVIIMVIGKHITSAKNSQYRRYVTFVWLMFVLLIGLRCTQTGQDTLMYGSIFQGLNRYKSYKEFMSDFNMVNNIEVGYATWQWLIHLVLDYRGFLICQAVLMITPFVYVVYKWSDNAVVSFVLYILLGYLTWNMCAGRQGTAVSFTLLSFYFYSCKKIKAFIISYLVAISFHTTALIFLPFIFLYRLLCNKKLLFLTLLASKIIGNYFIPLILPYMRIDYSEDVLSGSVGQLTYFGFLAVLLYVLYIEKAYKVALPNTFYLFSVMLILWPLVDTIAAAFRITFYFLIYLCFAIPTILKDLQKPGMGNVRRILTLAVTMIFSVYFYNMNLKPKGGRHVQPYYSVFEYPDNYSKSLYKD